MVTFANKKEKKILKSGTFWGQVTCLVNRYELAPNYMELKHMEFLAHSSP